MVDCLQNAYKGILYRMFILNASTLLKFLWGIIAGFMDPNTRAKMQVFSISNPKELTSLMMPSQLLKEYGGEADPPATYWPPVFPPNFREEFETKHIPPEEFKKELIAKAQMMPSPELAQFVRDSRRGKGKKGVFPRKDFNIAGKIQRRDSFNGIIQDDKPIQEQKSIETPQLIKEHHSKPKRCPIESKIPTDEDIEKVVIEEKKQEERKKVEVRDDCINVKEELRATDDIKVEVTHKAEPLKDGVERAKELSSGYSGNENKIVHESKRVRSTELNEAAPGCKCIII
jgi:hypothetical protein